MLKVPDAGIKGDTSIKDTLKKKLKEDKKCYAVQIGTKFSRNFIVKNTDLHALISMPLSTFILFFQKSC